MADVLPEIGWHHAHVWLPVRIDQVQAGDVYANWGTVTGVHHGPTLPLGGDHELADGEVRIECGEAFATTGRGDRLAIVGRRIARDRDA